MLKDLLCPYNEYILCEDQSRCKKCGWRPAVSLRRITAYKRKTTGEQKTNGESIPEREETMPGTMPEQDAGVPGKMSDRT